jgi:hypothetical protein
MTPIRAYAMYMKRLLPQVDRQHLHSFLLLSIEIAKKGARSGRRPSHSAMCESFFATPEYELIDRCRFRSHSEARMALFQFIEGFYNP